MKNTRICDPERSRIPIKNKKYRGLLSAFLIVLLIVGLVPASAYAMGDGSEEETGTIPETVQVPQSEAQENSLHTLDIVTADDPSVTDTFEVTFIVEGSEYAKATVASGGLCPAQIQPTVSGKRFTGWFYEDTDLRLVPFDFNRTVIDKDTTVTAYFEGETHMIRYMSSAGSDAIVLYTDQVPTQSIPQRLNVEIPEEQIPVGYVFQGTWLLNTAEYTFSAPLTSDITLVPALTQGYRVWFYTDGEAIEPQIVIKNAQVVKPTDPIRAGYTATGTWYRDEGRTSEYDFTAPVTAELKLYAGWIPNTDTPYEIHYFLERPGIPVNDSVSGGGLTEEQRHDPSNFTFLVSESKTGTTEAEVTLPENQVPSSVTTQIRSLLGSVCTATGYAKTLDFAHYSYSTKVKIKGDGSSVVEVYFERNVISLIFDLGASNSYTKSMTITRDGQTQTYYPGIGQPQYTVLSKIGLASNAIQSPYEPNSSTIIETTGQYFYGWGPANSQEFLESTKWLRDMNGQPLCDSSTNTSFTYKIKLIGSMVYPYEDHRMLESLDQSSPVNESEGRYFFNGRYFDDSSAKRVSYPLYTGRSSLGPLGYSPFWKSSSDQLADLSYIANGTIAGTTQFKLDSRSHTINQFDPYLECYFFYTRNAYNITFNSSGGTAVNTLNSILYGKDLDSYEPADPVRYTNGKQDSFLGWFDENGEPFSFEGTTMPYNNLILTAKWLAEPMTVSYFSSVSGTHIAGFYTEVAAGASAVAPFDASDPAALAAFKAQCGRSESDEFLGWSQRLSSGALMPYSFGQPVRQDLRLYARWNPPYAYNTVTYDLNGGTGTLPRDTYRYANGTTAVVGDGSGLTKDGSLFIGWTLQGGTDAYYQKGSAIRVFGNVTLVAQYAPKAKTINLTFRQNASVGDTAEVQWTLVQYAGAAYPSAYNLGFSKTGAVFLGWSTNPAALAADPAYEPGKSERHSNDLTLYAIWSMNSAQYTVHHLVVRGDELVPVEGWPQTYTTNASGNRLTTGSRVSATAPREVGRTLRRTAIGVNPYDHDSELTNASASLVLDSLGANIYANTITFYYVEDVNTVTPNPPVVDPPTTTTPSIPTPGSGTFPGAAPGSPILNLFGQDVPLMGITGGSWSLFDLFCTVMMVLTTLVGALWTIVRRRRKKEDDNENVSDNGEVQGTMAYQYEENEDKKIRERDDEERVRTIKPLLLILSALFSVVLIVLFVITQDITLPIVIFDLWSIVFGIGLIAGALITRLAFGKKKAKEDEEDEEDEEPDAAPSSRPSSTLV